MLFTVAHELVHGSKLDRLLSAVLLSTACYGHWSESHLQHHIKVAGGLAWDARGAPALFGLAIWEGAVWSGALHPAPGSGGNTVERVTDVTLPLYVCEQVATPEDPSTARYNETVWCEGLQYLAAVWGSATAAVACCAKHQTCMGAMLHHAL